MFSGGLNPSNEEVMVIMGLFTLLCHSLHSKVIETRYPRVLRKLEEEFTRPLSIIYHQSWLTRMVPDDWRLASVTPIHKKGQKKDRGNYRPVSLASVLRRVTCLVDEEEVVDVVHLGFSKVLDTVSHRILLEKLSAHGLGLTGLRTGWMAGPREW
ncbi:hypothetical protein WISP_26538 [Willisornis vidua]|uniref:Rna-directed dna polymerase from mobile element jockey-like n=1 Tax=Willisornis vidua TaxID=1566151 RepID=A0ABQ9DM40_9PASS|nr:hypothetical protein WISP_26538 [Willisornis vidua]